MAPRTTVKGIDLVPSTRLSQYVIGAAAKRLQPVEADRRTSNQHEFNGVNRIRSLLGTERATFPARFLYLDDDEVCPATGFVTWYDSRENVDHRGPEFRLYFPTNDASEKYAPGDLLVIARLVSDEILVAVARQASTVERQLLWLFGLPDPNGSFELAAGATLERDIAIAERAVLELLEIEATPVREEYLEDMLSRFDGSFPTTRIFSEYARSKADIDAQDATDDELIVAWWQCEEELFRTLERHIVARRIQEGFLDGDAVDVNSFVEFSLSVHNRRKSRAGHALENHLEAILQGHGLRFKRGGRTELRQRPDFLFPGDAEYADISFSTASLRMLGAKATCKDRWRQVLSEANRIEEKHLFTLEPSISSDQTDEMESKGLQLVVPRSLFTSYSVDQQNWLMDLGEFIDQVRLIQGV